MDEQVTQNITLASEKNRLIGKQMDIESGWLGKFFGTGPRCNIHIVGLIAIMLVLLGGLYTLLSNQAGDITSSLDFWKYVFPFLGTIVGYIFGKM